MALNVKTLVTRHDVSRGVSMFNMETFLMKVNLLVAMLDKIRSYNFMIFLLNHEVIITWQ
jgi:hypothetical protein